MRLSQAIREGAKLLPAYYEGHVRHDYETLRPLACDAMGGVYLLLEVEEPWNWETLDELRVEFPILSVQVECPEGRLCDTRPGRDLFWLLYHLQSRPHHWSREMCATFVHEVEEGKCQVVSVSTSPQELPTLEDSDPETPESPSLEKPPEPTRTKAANPSKEVQEESSLAGVSPPASQDTTFTLQTSLSTDPPVISSTECPPTNPTSSC